MFGDRAARDLAPGSPNRQVAEAAYVFLHPEYNSFGYEGYQGYTTKDIALIRFAQPVKYTYYVRPACVSDSSDESSVYQECRVAGWGLPNILGATTVLLRSSKECNESYPSITSVLGDDDSVICAGIFDGEESGACTVSCYMRKVVLGTSMCLSFSSSLME